MSKNKAAYETFISYRHKELDTRLAKAIHRQLETYRIPSNIAKRAGKKRMGKVFRDQDELPLLADLGEGVRRALEASEWLIVVCSPDLPESKWCMAEVDYFIELGRRDRILTVLIGGEPKESFPPQLRFEALNGETVEREPLAADVRGNSAAASLRKLRREKLRLLAPMLGVGYDDLRRRQRRRSMQMAAAAGLSVVLILSAFLAYALVQNTRLERQRNAALQSQSRFLSNISQEMNQAGDTMSALMLALEALPGDLQKPDRPLVAEAEAALRQAMQGPAGEGFVLDSGSRIENTAYMGAIPSADGRIILNINAAPYEEYNVFTGETLRRFDIVDGFFTGLFAYSPDGKYLALHSTKTISGDPRVVAERFEFYDSDRKLASFEHKGDYFTEQIRFAPGGNGEIRLTVRRTYTLEVYRCNRQSGFLEEEFHTNVLPAGEDAAYLRRVIWNPDGSRMLLSYGSKPDDWDSPVCAADGRTGKILGTVPVAEAVEWSPDGGRILCVREDGGYQLWDGEPGGVLIDLELPADVRVTDVYHRDYEYMPKFSPESGKVALLGADGICRVYRAADGAPLCSLSAAALADNLRSPDLESFSWSADGRYLACVSEFEEVFVFDAENGGLTQTPDTDGKSVSDALFIPGTNTIAVLGSDRPSIGQAGALLSGGAENLTAGDVFRAIPRIAGMILNAEDWEDKHLLFRIGCPAVRNTYRRQRF
ncbi:MAG: toll/interleukin-1 receptor domain-containing protein [Peptococcaceae bacterium]|jgi:WD40 repeat protein|nr:toll/interleukin-1 receptor domain-containing protein [Peptococcaceae bacterium]